MKLRPVFLLIFIVALLNLQSCKDFIEPNVGKRQLNLLAPGDRYQSNSFAVTFWWDEVEDANFYRLQIVTPSFDSIGALIADTLIKTNKFVLNIQPGRFQWRVRAENASSQSAFSSPRGFSVLNSSIRQQTVQLASPLNNSNTNQANINFQWGELYGANRYRLQIDTNNFADTAKLFFNESLAGTHYTYNFSKDREYQWRVRGENDTAASRWSVVRLVTLDRSQPGKVVLTSPETNLIVSLPVSLQWNTVTTASRYKLYVLKSDSTTNYNANFPVSVNGNTYNFNLGSTGERIYWKVSAIDAAGNEGQTSNMRNFVVK